MKVKTYKTLDLDVDITVEDITSTLTDSLQEAREEDDDRAFVLKSFVSQVAQCLRAIDDDLIARLNPEHRKLIADRLAEESRRFRRSVKRLPLIPNP